MASKRTYHVIVPATGEAIEYTTTGKEYAFAGLVFFPRRERALPNGEVEIREEEWSLAKQSGTESGAANHHWKKSHLSVVVPVIAGPAPTA